MTIWSVAMVTGHRPQHLGADALDWVAVELDRVAVKLAAEHATETAISGLALGTDLLWVQSARKAGLALRAHVPFPQQPDPWPAEMRSVWQRAVAFAEHSGGIVEYGDLCNYTETESKRAATRLLHERNSGMIRETVLHAGVVVAVLRPSRLEGGTRSAWDKAKESGLAIIHVNPDTRTVRLASAGRRQETLL